MQVSFSFARTPFVHFGAGKISLLPKTTKTFGNNILLLTGSSSFIQSQVWADLQQAFRDHAIHWTHCIIDREPTPAMIDSYVSQQRDKKIQAVIAIGGGSVLDAGKAVAAMITLGDPVKLYLEGIGTKIHPGSKVPFIAIPTTSGTGSEATKNAVLSEVGEKGFKKSLRHDNFVPEIAIIDPALTLSCPPHITASSGMDAFTQLLESYLSTAANPMTDALALSGLSRIKDSLLPAWKEGQENIEARTGMAYASYISGITLANAGLGTVHGFASALGGYFDISHGVICSTLMAPANRITVRKLMKSDSSHWALQKYEEVGKLFSDKQGQSKDFYIDYLLQLIEEWTLRIGIPKLSSLGVTQTDFDRIVKATDNKNNPIALDEAELREILELAL